jgi:hypothetical protein
MVVRGLRIQPSRREGATPSPVADVRFRIALVVVTGLAVGILTSFGQRYLNGALNAFVNSASAWLVAPFLLGWVMATRFGAAAAGLAACALQLVGYYVTAHLRGFTPGGSAILVFWGACGLVGGPLFGAAGHAWRTGRARERGIGATLLPAAFIAEGLWVYLHELHYEATAVLWLLIGSALVLVLPRGFAERRWLAVTLAFGLAGEAIVSHVYRQAF